MKELIEHSDEILKNILGKEKFRELLEYIPEVLDERIGKDHSTTDGIYLTRLLNKFILHLGMVLAEGKSIQDFEKILKPYYRVFIPFTSMEDLYSVFKEYIDIVANHNKKNLYILYTNFFIQKNIFNITTLMLNY